MLSRIPRPIRLCGFPTATRNSRRSWAPDMAPEDGTPHPALILQPLVSRAGYNGQMPSSVSVALDHIMRSLSWLLARLLGCAIAAGQRSPLLKANDRTTRTSLSELIF